MKIKLNPYDHNGKLVEKASGIFNNLKSKINNEKSDLEVNENLNINDISFAVNQDLEDDFYLSDSDRASKLKAKLDAIFLKNNNQSDFTEVFEAPIMNSQYNNPTNSDKNNMLENESSKENINSEILEKLEENPDNKVLKELAELFDS